MNPRGDRQHPRIFDLAGAVEKLPISLDTLQAQTAIHTTVVTGAIRQTKNPIRRGWGKKERAMGFEAIANTGDSAGNQRAGPRPWHEGGRCWASVLRTAKQRGRDLVDTLTTLFERHWAGLPPGLLARV